MDDSRYSSAAAGIATTQQYFIDGCQNCERRENLHEHHIVPQKNGGLDIPSNRVLLCSECHKAVHYDSLAPTAENPNHTLDVFGTETAMMGIEFVQKDQVSRQRKLSDR